MRTEVSVLNALGAFMLFVMWNLVGLYGRFRDTETSPFSLYLCAIRWVRYLELKLVPYAKA